MIYGELIRINIIRDVRVLEKPKVILDTKYALNFLSQNIFCNGAICYKAKSRLFSVSFLVPTGAANER
jgi:hypothetical protein